jgi:hypothetical protein
MMAAIVKGNHAGGGIAFKGVGRHEELFLDLLEGL